MTSENSAYTYTDTYTDTDIDTDIDIDTDTHTHIDTHTDTDTYTSIRCFIDEYSVYTISTLLHGSISFD